MKFYEVEITKTGKPFGRTEEDYSTFDREVKRFKTTEEVKAFLKESYGTCKRVKMYQDTKEGSEHTGYIYCFKNKDWSHDSKGWFQQDWVSIDEMKSTRFVLAA